MNMTSPSTDLIYAVNNLQASINNLTILFYKSNAPVIHFIASMSSINTCLLLVSTTLNNQLSNNHDPLIKNFVKNINSMIINIGNMIESISDLLSEKYINNFYGHLVSLISSYANMISGMASIIIGTCGLNSNVDLNNNISYIFTGITQIITALTLVLNAIYGIINYVISDKKLVNYELQKNIVRVITIIDVTVATTIDMLNQIIALIKIKLPDSSYALINIVGMFSVGAGTLLSSTNVIANYFGKIDENIGNALAQLLSTTNTFMGTINSITIAINTQ